MVLSQGKFEQNMWYENPYFRENASVKQHVEELVAGTFPTSKDAEAIELEGDSRNKPSVVTSIKPDGNPISLQTMFLSNVSRMSKVYKPAFNIVKELYR